MNIPLYSSCQKTRKHSLMLVMGWMAVLVTLGIGIGTVLQSTLNRQMSRTSGLTSTTLFNNCVVLFLSLALYLAVKSAPLRFSEIFRTKENLMNFHWWSILPGICGLAVVLGLPWAIGQIGALKVFLILVAAQMVSSAFWDIAIEGVPLNGYRIAGIGLAVSGALLTFIKG